MAVDALAVSMGSLGVSFFSLGWQIVNERRKWREDRALLRVGAEVRRDQYRIEITFVLANRGRRPITIRTFEAIDDNDERYTFDDQLAVDLPVTLEESKHHEVTIFDDAFDGYPVIRDFEAVDTFGRLWAMGPAARLQLHRDVQRERLAKKQAIEAETRRGNEVFRKELDEVLKKKERP